MCLKKSVPFHNLSKPLHLAPVFFSSMILTPPPPPASQPPFPVLVKAAHFCCCGSLPSLNNNFIPTPLSFLPDFRSDAPEGFSLPFSSPCFTIFHVGGIFVPIFPPTLFFNLLITDYSFSGDYVFSTSFYFPLLFHAFWFFFPASLSTRPLQRESSIILTFLCISHSSDESLLKLLI